MTPVPCPLVALVTDALEGPRQVLAHGVGTTKGPVPALIHICKDQKAISIEPSRKLESLPRPTYYPVDTHPGTRPLGWADSRGRRLGCSGRSQGCSHSAGLHKWQSRILGTRPHLQGRVRRVRGRRVKGLGGGGCVLKPLPIPKTEKSLSMVFEESRSS